jgi:tRNA A37 threonylcarbamoyladenosine synthetase subunit TsaC/SUA5/YrdC
MGEHQSAFDEGQGQPNLEALQYLADFLTPTVVSATLRTAKKSITADATGGLAVSDIPVGAKIIDVHVVCTSANGSGTMTVKTGATVPAAITDAIDCTTDKAIDRAATIDDAYNVVGADGVKVFSNGADDRGDVYIMYMK